MLVAIVIFSMVAMYGFLPMIPLAKAASLESAKDTLSDSDIDAVANHTFVINLGDANPLTGGQFVRIDFNPGGGAAEFGDPVAATLGCPSDTSASTTPGLDYIECTVDAGLFLESTSTQQITVNNLQNPDTANPYDIVISTHQANGTEIESSGIKVYILSDVLVTAHVDASLSFTVGELGPDAGKTSVNGIAITASSTDTSLAFGDLSTTASSTLGHSLAVSTNAQGGFVVTVQQSDELKNGAGATINSFDNSPDDTGSSTAHTWAGPTGILDYDHTYGHMGITGDDSDLWTAKQYVGLNDTDALTVFSHDGPADQQTQDAGLAAVAYTIEITALQEAGDYETTLTYICTPTY